jgi:hypothetical protein
MSVPFAAFGPGILIVTRTDLATPVAINVGFAQELTIDFTGTTKQLYGQKQFPLVAARGTIKATGKWKAAVISGIAWNNAFYGGSFTSGGINWNIDSTFTTSTTVATVQVGSSATFEADLGVKYGATATTPNFPLQRVATGSETTGKYSVASTQAGLYTFGGGDLTSQTPIKVTFTNTTATGQSLIVTNQNIGFTPAFQLDYYTSLSQPTAKPFAVRLYACIGGKHAMGFKLEDFAMPEFDFDMFADASDRVIDYVFPEIS